MLLITKVFKPHFNALLLQISISCVCYLKVALNGYIDVTDAFVAEAFRVSCKDCDVLPLDLLIVGMASLFVKSSESHFFKIKGSQVRQRNQLFFCLSTDVFLLLRFAVLRHLPKDIVIRVGCPTHLLRDPPYFDLKVINLLLMLDYFVL